MIPPRQQWVLQIDVTNACQRRCSNCTRLTAHCRSRYFMSLPEFESACIAAEEFPTDSEPDKFGRRKVVGVMGGEPLLHPQFAKLVDIMCDIIPEPSHRGLWTGIDYHGSDHEDNVLRLLSRDPTTTTRPVPRGAGGYLNLNLHNTDCRHAPILVAIQDVVHNEEEMWSLIGACPLQEKWAGAITRKGFFFCEVAAALDWVFDGPGGVPVSPACWRHDLADYRDQIEMWCPRCGIPLPLESRPDCDEKDDISTSNLEALRKLGSPRVLAGDVVVFDGTTFAQNWNPLQYLKNR